MRFLALSEVEERDGFAMPGFFQEWIQAKRFVIGSQRFLSHLPHLFKGVMPPSSEPQPFKGHAQPLRGLLKGLLLVRP